MVAVYVTYTTDGAKNSFNMSMENLNVSPLFTSQYPSCFLVAKKLFSYFYIYLKCTVKYLKQVNYS